MKLFIKHLKHKHSVKHSINIAIVVGIILALINHYDAIFTGTLTTTNIIQILITPLVPFSVSMYGSAMHGRELEMMEKEMEEENMNKDKDK